MLCQFIVVRCVSQLMWFKLVYVLPCDLNTTLDVRGGLNGPVTELDFRVNIVPFPVINGSLPPLSVLFS